MTDNKSAPTLTFPCDFPIKVMGLANDDFEITVLHIIHQHCPDLAETAIQTRHSKNKKYLSLTVTIKVQNQQQLDTIYKDLSAAKQVLMVL